MVFFRVAVLVVLLAAPAAATASAAVYGSDVETAYRHQRQGRHATEQRYGHGAHERHGVGDELEHNRVVGEHHGAGVGSLMRRESHRAPAAPTREEGSFDADRGDGAFIQEEGAEPAALVEDGSAILLAEREVDAKISDAMKALKLAQRDMNRAVEAEVHQAQKFHMQEQTRDKEAGRPAALVEGAVASNSERLHRYQVQAEARAQAHRTPHHHTHFDESTSDSASERDDALEVERPAQRSDDGEMGPANDDDHEYDHEGAQFGPEELHEMPPSFVQLASDSEDEDDDNDEDVEPPVLVDDDRFHVGRSGSHRVDDNNLDGHELILEDELEKAEAARLKHAGAEH